MAKEIFPSIIVLFCAHVIGSASHVFVEMFPSNNTYDLNVTAYTGNGKRYLEIVHEPSTWFEAFYKCPERGWTRLMNLMPGSKILRGMTQILREGNTYSTANASFWLGFFRPYLNLDSWFRTSKISSNPTCDEYTTAYVVDKSIGSSDQCVYISYQDFYNAGILVSSNCSTKLPYFCFEHVANEEEFQIYNGFDVLTIPGLLNAVNVSDTDFEYCSNNCSNNYLCASFSYYNDSRSCISFDLDPFYNHLMYNLSRVTYNVTHVVKDSNRFNLTFTTVNLSIPEEDLAFPACIPSGYCPAENKTNMLTTTPVNYLHLENVLSEIIKNLTIDPDTTSKNKQRYQCASDERTSSRTFGAVAVLIITCVYIIPVVLDSLTYLDYRSRKQVKLKKRHIRTKVIMVEEFL